MLALVKRYTSDHPTITFDGLRAPFPDRLQADSPSQFDRLREGGDVVALGPRRPSKFVLRYGSRTR